MKKLLFVTILSFLFAFQSCQEEKLSVLEVVTPQQVYDAVYSKGTNAQLLDVRTQEEYVVNHLKNAQNICVTNNDFQEKVKKLDKDKPVYVYCEKGRRSANAAKILTEMGFKKVYDLQGGITNWEESGLETQK